MSRRGIFDRVPKAQIRIIGATVKVTKVGSMVTINVRVVMSEMETTTATTTSTRVVGNRNDRNCPYVPPQNREVTPRDGGYSMARVEDMLHKMMRRFAANDEHIKELKRI